MATRMESARISPSLGTRVGDALRRFFDGDVYFSFKRSPVVVVAFATTVLLFAVAALAPWIAPHNTNEVATLNLMDARLPPAGVTDTFGNTGSVKFLLGTDDQGRDMLSAIMFGLQISLGVGFASVILAAIFGTTLGLLSGYVGGRVDSFIMRIADIQLTFPAILIALMIDGIVGGILPRAMHEELKLYVLVLAIGASQWVNFARTVRGSTMVEKGKEYVQAARVIGVHRM